MSWGIQNPSPAAAATPGKVRGCLFVWRSAASQGNNGLDVCWGSAAECQSQRHCHIHVWAAFCSIHPTLAVNESQCIFQPKTQLPLWLCHPPGAEQSLPRMCHREAPALADAFVHEQLSEKARRVPWRTAGRDFWRRRSVPRQLGKLEF